MNAKSDIPSKNNSSSVKKEVTIIISNVDLGILKKAKYKLCIAKKIESYNYNVVWRSFHNYLHKNTISWIPNYQLFGSKKIHENKKIIANTNLVNIGPGETSILNSIGILKPPKTKGPIDAISMNNQLDKIFPGLKQHSTGINGGNKFTISNVHSNYIIKGTTAEFVPLEKILVWFEQDIETSSFFTSPRSLSKEVDLSTENTATIKFSNEKWV